METKKRYEVRASHGDKDMENTQTAYTEADKAAVQILRVLYASNAASDTLYNARQYLQDRARYERNMLRCECGQDATPEQLERLKRFGIKADPRGHVHSFQSVSLTALRFVDLAEARQVYDKWSESKIYGKDVQLIDLRYCRPGVPWLLASTVS